MPSKAELGRNFELEAYEFLLSNFKKVNWLSKKNRRTRYDFNCFDGEKWCKVEAKMRTTSNRPSLRRKQKNADYVIFRGKENKIRLIYKDDFKELLYIYDKEFKIPSQEEALSISFGWGKVVQVAYSPKILMNPDWCKKINLKVGDMIDVEDAIINKSIPEELEKAFTIPKKNKKSVVVR